VLPSAVALAPAQAGAHPRPSTLTLVRPRRRLTSVPTADLLGRRAQWPSRTALFQRRRRLVLVWGLMKSSTKWSTYSPFRLPSLVAPFPCSTAPQAFPRPDRRMLRPARAGRVKAGRSSAATRRARPWRVRARRHAGSVGAWARCTAH